MQKFESNPETPNWSGQIFARACFKLCPPTSFTDGMPCLAGYPYHCKAKDSNSTIVVASTIAVNARRKPRTPPPRMNAQKPDASRATYPAISATTALRSTEAARQSQGKLNVSGTMIIYARDLYSSQECHTSLGRSNCYFSQNCCHELVSLLFLFSIFVVSPL
jgi:hypothetical protein